MQPPPSTPKVTRPWRGESAQERQQQRRERLLKAAFEAFAEYGIARTTMRDICSRARLTERYFYESFSSTEHAFDAVYADLKQELVTNVTQAMMEAPRNVEALARAGLRAFYTFIQQDPRRGKLLLIDAVSANQLSIERSRSAMKQYVALIDELARELDDNGALGSMDIEWLAWGLLGLAIQVGNLWLAEGMKRPIDEVLDYNLYAWRGLVGWIQQGPPASRTSAALHLIKPAPTTDGSTTTPEPSPTKRPRARKRD